ncbi:ABC transporter permease [Bacteroidota bacterium]
MNFTIIRILLRRFFSSVILLFFLVSFIFILLRYSPGDPVQKFISPELSPQLSSQIRESFGLNESIFSQYFRFIQNFTTGDMGISYNYRIPVLSVIQDYLPFTLIFSLISFTLMITIGLWTAILSSRKIDGIFDRVMSKLSLVAYSLPVYVFGIVLIYMFSLILPLFPSSDLHSFNFQRMTFFEKLFDYFRHMTLPVITLSTGGIVIFYKYLRDNISMIYNKPFVLNLRASGVPENKILYKHVIPNAIGPFVSIAGIELGMLFGGALITEVIFGLPGMGRLAVNAILFRDYPLVVGCTFISGFLIIITNLFADIVKVKIDKRLIKEILN